LRLFVAIELEPALTRQLARAQQRLAEYDREVRWTRPEQMHLTLKFLGDVPDAQVPAVCTTAANVAATTKPFDMTLGACGCFPPRGPVRIVHVSINESTGMLLRCQQLCEDAYADLGFPPENRAFTPHLTIGRVREDRTNGRLRAAVGGVRCEASAQSVDSLCVVQSVLAPSGARYTPVARHALAGN